MRFGFSHHPEEHYREHAQLVAHAERLGWDQAWLPDQTFHRDPYVVLAACAAATERIALGLAVTNAYTRHPAVTARAAATVGEVADGRFQLAIGAGNRRELLDPLGLESGDPAGRSAEMAAIVRGLLDGEEVTLDGRYFQVSGVRLDFEPPHRVPLNIAGRGRKMLRVAGEIADGAIIGGLSTPLGVDYAWREIEAGAERAGRRLDGLEVVSWVTCTLTDDREAVLAGVRPMVAHIIGGAPADMLREVGIPDETIAAVKDEYGRTGKEGAAALVTDTCVDTFAVIGDAGHCLQRIRDLEQAGVTQFGMLLPPGTVADHRVRLEAFAEQVIAPYRAAAGR